MLETLTAVPVPLTVEKGEARFTHRPEFLCTEGFLSGTIARHTFSCHGDPQAPLFSTSKHPTGTQVDRVLFYCHSSELGGRGWTQATLEHVARNNGDGQFLLEELAEIGFGALSERYSEIWVALGGVV